MRMRAIGAKPIGGRDSVLRWKEAMKVMTFYVAVSTEVVSEDINGFMALNALNISGRRC